MNRPKVDFDNRTILHVIAKRPDVVKKDLQRRHRQQIEAVDKQQLIESPAHQIRDRGKEHPEDEYACDIGQSNTYRTDDEVSTVLQAGFDILPFDEQIQPCVVSEWTHSLLATIDRHNADCFLVEKPADDD